MNIHRLTVLENHLRNVVQDEHFDMTEWSCGTVACAMGHAATIPEFKAAGLQLMSCNNDVNNKYIAFGGFIDYSAAADFMDISRDDAIHLFNPSPQRSRIEVADRIRDFIVENS